MDTRGSSNDAPTSRDTVLLAFLFTDLVGSTALTAYLGVEAAERFRRQHFAMLRLQLDRYGGEEVKSVGDGVMATFASVHRALDAACAMQMSVHRAGGVGGHPVTIRVGLTVGDAVPHRGDYYGLAVNEAARLCNHAQGGEVLVSQAVALIGAPTDHRFVRRGAAELHGLPGPTEVFELDWPRDRHRVDFPLPARVSAEVSFRFVGRERGQLHLSDALDAAAKGNRQLVLIAGEPGIGKTALVTQVLRVAAEASELAVLYGQCDEDLPRPYGPFAAAIGHVAASATSELLEDLRDAVDPALFRLAPQLAERLGEPDERRGDGEGERAVLFDAVVGFFDVLTSRCPVALVVDDLHWADTATLALFRHLGRATASMALTLIGTFRDTEIDEAHPLSDSLAVLARLDGVRNIALAGFDDDEVISLVAAAAGYELDHDARQFARDLGREAAGNPYFIVEILRDLVERGLIVQDEGGTWRGTGAPWQAMLPRTVRDVIVQRVQRLGQPVLRCLGAAAVYGNEFDPLLVAAAADVALDDVVEALDKAAAAALVTEAVGVGGRLTFAHGLVQRTLYEALGVLRRQQLHRALARALEESVSANRALEPVLAADLARHWTAAGRVETMDRAFAWALRAGDAALAALAPEDAERWFASALELLDQLVVVDPTDRVRTLLRSGVAQRQAGRAHFRETLLEAARLALEAGADELLVDAVLANNRGIQSSTGSGDDERLAMLDAALAASAGIGPRPRARLLALSALERLHIAPFEQRLALADEALAVARESGDAETIAQVLTVRHNAIRVPATLEQRLADTAEAMALTAHSDDLLAQYWATEHRVRSASEVPDLAEVDRCLDRCAHLADRLAQPGLRYYLAMHASWRRLLAGDLRGAEDAANAARHIGHDTGQPEADSMFVAQLLAVRREQGRHGELAPRLYQALDANPGIAALRSSVSLLHVVERRLDDAAAVFATDARARFETMPYNTLWSTALVQYSDVAAALHDVDAAAVLLERLAPHSGHFAHNSATCAGPIDRALGILSGVLGRMDDAERYFRRAEETCERIEAPLLLARVLLAWARTVPDPGAEGRGRLRRAEELARACGAEGLSTDIARSIEVLESP
ncbi:MAG: AAA family ATPase [Acidimicrobiales bacterium]